MGPQGGLGSSEEKKVEEDEYSDKVSSGSAAGLLAAGSAGNVHRHRFELSPPAAPSHDNNLQQARDGEKSLRPCSTCGNFFKDLRSHMLTHLADRPYKCPVSSCDFHSRGFARKYDQARHTICHYRGFIVCEFCPGANSPDEVSFHRVDALKRHLIHVHRVEPTKKSRKAPRSQGRTRWPDGTQVDDGDNMIIGGTGGGTNRDAKCSLCAYAFRQAQDWYDHLDDCILSTILQDVPANHINTLHLLSVADDHEVGETLHLHRIQGDHGLQQLRPPLRDGPGGSNHDEQQGMDKTEQIDAVHQKGEEEGDQTRESEEKTARGASMVDQGRGRRNRRKDGRYPQYWGVSPETLNLKRRALYVHDGPCRIWKDDLLLYTSLEVRVPLQANAAHDYVTDLDVQTLHTAESIYHTYRSTPTTTHPENF